MTCQTIQMSARQLLLTALLLISGCCWASEATSLEQDLKETLYKKCWKTCQETNKVSPSEEAVLALIDDSFDLPKHEEHCRAFNASKTCAYDCLASPKHEHYIRPFLRQNYLNDFICVRHYEEFRKYLPCYRNHQSLEQHFRRCGYFAIDHGQQVLQANTETCNALKCVTRYIPGLIRQQQCFYGDEELAEEAANMMARMINAFLREKVRLNKMRRLCEETF